MKSKLKRSQSVGTYSDFYAEGFKYFHAIVVLGKGNGRPSKTKDYNQLIAECGRASGT